MRMSRIESAVRIALEFSKAFNRHDVAAMMQLVADDGVLETATPAPDGTVYTGKEAIAQFWEDLFLRSPHAQAIVEELFGMGIRCVAYWRYVESDTQKHVRGVDILELKNGLIYKQQSFMKGQYDIQSTN